MRYVTAGLVLLPAAVLQVTLAPRLAVAGVFPNLVLVAVAGWTLVRGPGPGLGWAVAGGLLLDLVSPGPVGVHALALVAAAYAAGLLQRSFEPDAVLLPAAAAALATVVYNLVLVALAGLLGHPVDLLPALQAWVAPAALYQAALAPLGLLLLKRLDRAVPPPVVIDW